ncbi:hypothetical protein FACS189430_08340 [Bacteroidia bacterium]|nr:hypothetical protein FACS189430_08340 [Bacteroidia bacterium]
MITIYFLMFIDAFSIDNFLTVSVIDKDYTATRYLAFGVIAFPWVKTHGYQDFVPMGQFS